MSKKTAAATLYLLQFFYYSLSGAIAVHGVSGIWGNESSHFFSRFYYNIFYTEQVYLPSEFLAMTLNWNLQVAARDCSKVRHYYGPQHYVP